MRDEWWQNIYLDTQNNTRYNNGDGMVEEKQPPEWDRYIFIDKKEVAAGSCRALKQTASDAKKSIREAANQPIEWRQEKTTKL